jgi:hypothetical protein
VRGHPVRQLKVKFAITDFCYAGIISYLNLPVLFRAVDCILSP